MLSHEELGSCCCCLPAPSPASAPAPSSTSASSSLRRALALLLLLLACLLTLPFLFDRLSFLLLCLLLLLLLLRFLAFSSFLWFSLRLRCCTFRRWSVYRCCRCCSLSFLLCRCWWCFGFAFLALVAVGFAGTGRGAIACCVRLALREERGDMNRY